MQFANVKAVLFDAVGTLIRPVPSVADAYFAAGRKYGSSRTSSEIAARFASAWRIEQHREPVHSGDSETGVENFQPLLRNPTSESLEVHRWQRIVAHVLDDVVEAQQQLFTDLWDHFSESCHWRLFDDVPSAWNSCRELGLRVGIASNFDGRLVRLCSQFAPLTQCPALFYSSAVGFSKPDPRFFDAVAKQLELRPNQILLVGDDLENDLIGARAAGWHALLIDRDRRNPSAEVIHSLIEISGLFRADLIRG